MRRIAIRGRSTEDNCLVRMFHIYASETMPPALCPQVHKSVAHLRDTLLVLPPVQDGPCNSSRVLALEEQ